MSQVRGGKVTRVDSDSGHYKPATLHLRNFVGFLDLYDVFAPAAVVSDEGAKSYNVPFRVFLAGGEAIAGESIAQRMVRIRRDWERHSKKEVSLAGLVEERFQLMRENIGPGPNDDVLWTRAYKAVCIDFGEIDRGYLRKSKSPPIPRTSAREAVRRAG